LHWLQSRSGDLTAWNYHSNRKCGTNRIETNRFGTLRKIDDDYGFFGSDGAFQARRDWKGLAEGSDKYGTVSHRKCGSIRLKELQGM
jgi:hypothetical protein